MICMQICSSNILKPSPGCNERRRDEVCRRRDCSTSLSPKNIGRQLSCGDKLGFPAAAQKAGRAEQESNILTHSSDSLALKI